MNVETKHTKGHASSQKDSEVFLIADDKLTIYNNLSFHHLNKEKYQHIHQYALLCESIYHDDPQQYLKEIKESENFNFLSSKWRIININIGKYPATNYRIKSLKYNIWFNKKLNKIVIVYRGTQSVGDWYSNLKWFTHIIPFIDDHYDQVMNMTESIVKLLKEKYYDTEIITTGHSLGGGLAQQAAYTSKHIKKAFAFNPTPITGYYNLKLSRKVIYKENLDIFKIYEYGEVLYYLRKFKRYIFGISKINPSMNVVQFNRQSKGVFTEHNMFEFAKQLNGILKENKEYVEAHTDDEVRKHQAV